MFLKLPKYNSSLAPGFTNKELKDEISRQRTNTRFKQQFEEFWEQQKTKGRGAEGAPPPLFFERSKIVQTGAYISHFSLTAD